MEKEMLLIKALAKTEINKEIVEEILVAGIDWGTFIEEVHKNEIINLVFFNLKKHQLLNYIPRYLYPLFQSYWNEIVVKSNAYFEYIEKIVCMLDKANVSYVFIKGFDLINKLYQDKSRYIREFKDLDILVSAQDLSKTEKIFLDEGFVFGDYDFKRNEIIPASRYDVVRMQMGSHQIHAMVKKVNYEKDGIFVGPIFVDVNFTIFDGGKNVPVIATEKLLETADIRKSFNGIEYKTLNIYYAFIQLVYHLFREAHTELLKKQSLDINLRKFCDIYEYLLWAEDKWEIRILTELVYDANLVEPFWFVLYFTDMLYETTFHQTILDSNASYEEKYKNYILYFKDRFQIP